MPHKRGEDNKRTIMRAFQIDEISAVDHPAQEGAKAVLMKRAEGLLQDKSERVVKRMRLVSSLNGHAHLLDDDTADGGTLSWERGTGDEFGHSHPWARDKEGRIVVGESFGHSHELLDDYYSVEKCITEDGFFAEDFAHAPDKENPETWKFLMKSVPGGPYEAKAVLKAAEELNTHTDAPKEAVDTLYTAWRYTHNQDLSATPEIFKEYDMPTIEEMQAQLDERDKKIAALEAKIADAAKVSDMDDEEKKFYREMNDTEKAAYLALDKNARMERVQKARESNAVIYTDSEGIEYRKNDDPRMVALAKRADADRKAAQEEREVRKNVEYAKRAEELNSLPGDTDVKVAVLKAVDTITDEGVRQKATEMLRAHNAAAAGLFVTKGTSTSPVSVDANTQLDNLAKAYAKAHGVPYLKAYDEVLRTSEGTALYEKTLTVA